MSYLFLEKQIKRKELNQLFRLKTEKVNPVFSLKNEKSELIPVFSFFLVFLGKNELNEKK